MVVTDPGIRGLGLVDRLVEGAEMAGVRCSVYDKIREDPPESTILELVDFAKTNGAESFVGVGGGSSMDAAKLAAFMCGDTSQNIADIYGVDLAVGRRLPLVQV